MKESNETVVRIQLCSAPEGYRPGAVLAGYDERGRLAEVICAPGDAAAVCELLAEAVEGGAG